MLTIANLYADIYRASLLQVISPNFCLAGRNPFPPFCSRDVVRLLLFILASIAYAVVSEAVLRILRRGATVTLGVPSTCLPFVRMTGFSAGAIEGMMSLANSLTSTAPSCLLSFSTISYIPYFSTNAVRFGWTSQIAFNNLSNVNRTTALL